MPDDDDDIDDDTDEVASPGDGQESESPEAANQ
jgi:hypothetical protein